MSDNEKEVCKNGCTDCGCGSVTTAQLEQTSEGDIAPGISAVNEPVSALEEAVEKAIARRQRLEEACAPGGVGEYSAANRERLTKLATEVEIEMRAVVNDNGINVLTYDLCNDGAGDKVLKSLKAMGDAATIFESARTVGHLNEDDEKLLAQYQKFQGTSADFDGAEVHNPKTGEIYYGPVPAYNVVAVTRDENGGITLEVGNEAPVCDEHEFLDAAGNKHYGTPPVTLTQNADGTIAVDCGGATADEVAEAIAGALEQSGIDPETAYPVGISDETEATAAMVFGLPQITTNSELVAAVNAIEADKLAAAVGDMITAAKETVRIGAVDMSFSPQDDLLLDRVIKALTTDGVEYPQLLNFVPALESQRNTLLGEAVAYRDAHARAMTHFWSMTMADVGNPATLAARAKIDITEVGNYNDDAWMQWWSETLRPWCITYGHLYGPDQEALETKNDTDGGVAAVSSVEES